MTRSRLGRVLWGKDANNLLTCGNSSVPNQGQALIVQHSIYFSGTLLEFSFRILLNTGLLAASVDVLDLTHRPFARPGPRPHDEAPFGCCQHLARIEL